MNNINPKIIKIFVLLALFVGVSYNYTEKNNNLNIKTEPNLKKINKDKIKKTQSLKKERILQTEWVNKTQQILDYTEQICQSPLNQTDKIEKMFNSIKELIPYVNLTCINGHKLIGNNPVTAEMIQRHANAFFVTTGQAIHPGSIVFVPSYTLNLEYNQKIDEVIKFYNQTILQFSSILPKVSSVEKIPIKIKVNSEFNFYSQAREINVKDLDTTTLIHELFHAILGGKGHPHDSIFISNENYNILTSSMYDNSKNITFGNSQKYDDIERTKFGVNYATNYDNLLYEKPYGILAWLNEYYPNSAIDVNDYIYSELNQNDKKLFKEKMDDLYSKITIVQAAQLQEIFGVESVNYIQALKEFGQKVIPNRLKTKTKPELKFLEIMIYIGIGVVAVQAACCIKKNRELLNLRSGNQAIEQQQNLYNQSQNEVRVIELSSNYYNSRES